MNEVLIIGSILVAVVVLIVIFISRKITNLSNVHGAVADTQKENQRLQIDLAESKNAYEYACRDIERLTIDLGNQERKCNVLTQTNSDLVMENQQLIQRLSRFEVENSHLKEAYSKLNLTLDELKQQMNNEFKQLKTLAINELEQKANQSLREISKDSVVMPLQEHFKDLQNKIQELAIETKHINQNSQNLNKQAENLAIALTKDSKKKGDFGELILTNLLESVGLQEHISYVEQEQIKLGDKRLIPDVVVNLPHDRAVVIDSKNIMQHYYNSISNNQDGSKAVIDAIRLTFKQLGDKDYVTALEMSSPKSIFAYAIMFIPNEGVFNLIVSEDQSLGGMLFREAYHRKVFIAGPSTLLVLLGMIERAWETYLVEERAEQIIQLAQEAADKIKLTFERVADLGKTIQKSATQYNDVITALDNDRAGSVVDKLDKIVQHSTRKHKLADLHEIDAKIKSPASLSYS